MFGSAAGGRRTFRGAGLGLAVRLIIQTSFGCVRTKDELLKLQIGKQRAHRCTQTPTYAHV